MYYLNLKSSKESVWAIMSYDRLVGLQYESMIDLMYNEYMDLMYIDLS